MVSTQYSNDYLDPSKNNVVSSAYCEILNSFEPINIPLILSFFRIITANISAHKTNRYGEIGSPCLQPLRIVNHGETKLLTITRNLMFFRNIPTHFLISSLKLNNSNVLNMNFHEIVSKAFSKSISSRIPL